ncbi:hypothetical protein [Streptomyces sp. NPDC006631]|uniref:hypothetical protein n=1 Tax=Streptomyces sp. NPDC006631 TaxID=3364752 RepID=UPI0036CEC626
MESFKVVWTEAGVRRVSVVSYDKASAEHRIRTLPEGTSDPEMVPVKPGETVVVEQPRRGRVVQRKHTVKRSD